jgi:hypothetical protein
MIQINDLIEKNRTGPSHLVPSVASLVLVADPISGIESQVNAPRNPQSELQENSLNQRQNRQSKRCQNHNPRFNTNRLGNLHSRQHILRSLPAGKHRPRPNRQNSLACSSSLRVAQVYATDL